MLNANSIVWCTGELLNLVVCKNNLVMAVGCNDEVSSSVLLRSYSINTLLS